MTRSERLEVEELLSLDGDFVYRRVCREPFQRVWTG